MPVHRDLILETERLRLRNFREEDWKDVHEYATDPLVSEFQEWGPNSIRDTKNFVANCIKAADNPSGLSYFLSISRLEDDKHVGGCVLTLAGLSSDECSIGYTISRRFWGQGYATEAAEALLQFAFRLGLKRVKANCDSGNVASWRVMQKIGMRLARTKPEAKYFKGHWRDWMEYEISFNEWSQNSD